MGKIATDGVIWTVTKKCLKGYRLPCFSLKFFLLKFPFGRLFLLPPSFFFFGV